MDPNKSKLITPRIFINRNFNGYRMSVSDNRIIIFIRNQQYMIIAPHICKILANQKNIPSIRTNGSNELILTVAGLETKLILQSV